MSTSQPTFYGWITTTCNVAAVARRFPQGSKLEEMNPEMAAHFFNGIFPGGVVTEKRIESAGMRIIELTRTGDTQGAKEAERILGDILILAIADGRARNPEACAFRYLTVCQAALGELSLLQKRTCT